MSALPDAAALTERAGGRCLVMGVVNVTPDSFSDGGRWFDPADAVAHGRELAGRGAEVLDVGGESTRPGAARVDAAEELRRVVPVVRALAQDGHLISVDTMRAAVAEAALVAGACIVNDVSGGLADPGLPRLAADAGAVYVAMHWRGHSATMDDLARYDGPGGAAAAVVDELRARVEQLLGCGLDPARLVLDPGLGFAKNAEHNWQVLRHLDQLIALGFPVLVGASRKRFLGQLLAADDGTPAPAHERDAATAATSALAAAAGAWGVRVHEVAGSAAAVRVAKEWGSPDD